MRVINRPDHGAPAFTIHRHSESPDLFLLINRLSKSPDFFLLINPYGYQ